MTMTDTDAPRTALTKRDLVEQNFGALDPRRVERVTLSDAMGGLAFADMLQVMEFAKTMAMADVAVPKHLRANAGMCLAVTVQAVAWRMEPFAVANKSYVVNDRLAFESQLIHAVIEARAPLLEPLDCTYSGTGLERKCKVIGKFVGGFVREYESPQLKDIKVKNSPLWTGDPDQQLWYYSSRAWARKWCPHVILGVYSRDEIIEDPNVGRAEEPPPLTLHQRLSTQQVSREEGHQEGQAAQELKTVNGTAEAAPVEQDNEGGGATLEQDGRPSLETPISKLRDDLGARAVNAIIASENADISLADLLMKTTSELLQVGGLGKVSAAHVVEAVKAMGYSFRQEDAPAPVEASAPLPEPKNVKEWVAYCRTWLKATTDHKIIRTRWNAERSLRNSCGVTSDDRDPIMAEMVERCKELGE